MQQTIYFGQKPLILFDELNEEIENILKQPEVIYYVKQENNIVNKVIHQIQEKEVAGIIIKHNAPGALLQQFKEAMILIQAAGGLVSTDTQKVLLIFRKKKWDLPKGKLDEGESMEACAIREVKEETGLQYIDLEGPLQITYHTYYQDHQLIIKESHWFLMKSNEQTDLQPQLDEDIEQCVWVPFNDLVSYTDNTHPSVLDVLKTGMQYLGKKE